jgi:cytochrome c5
MSKAADCPEHSAFERVATIVVAAVVVSAMAHGQETAKLERGEEILNGACTTCHDTRVIDTQALDEAGWTKEVKTMIEKGAEVKAADLPVLVDYLTRVHGPLPDGPGKEVVLNVCTQCHDLQRVRRERLSPAGWAEILQAMLNEGAPLTDQDFATVLRYLARNFRPEPPYFFEARSWQSSTTQIDSITRLGGGTARPRARIRSRRSAAVSVRVTAD